MLCKASSGCCRVAAFAPQNALIVLHKHKCNYWVLEMGPASSGSIRLRATATVWPEACCCCSGSLAHSSQQCKKVHRETLRDSSAARSCINSDQEAQVLVCSGVNCLRDEANTQMHAKNRGSTKHMLHLSWCWEGLFFRPRFHALERVTCCNMGAVESLLVSAPEVKNRAKHTPGKSPSCSISAIEQVKECLTAV